MEAIAVINQKGGVGKSTTAHAVGAGLSLRGFRVLYVDLDAQGNLSYTLGADTEGITVMDILRNQAPVREVVRKVEQGDVIPSSPALARPYFCRGKATARPTASPGQAGPYILRHWTWQRYWHRAQLRRSEHLVWRGQGGGGVEYELARAEA